MQYTTNYNLKKPQYGETADVADINYNADTIDGLIHGNRTMLAPAYSQLTQYKEGDIVVYEGHLYRCLAATTGNWDNSKWTQTTLGTEVSEGGGVVTKIATGNPIEISDAASAPMVECVTQITGSQDLHGYDKPWVGGAGKNKFDKTTYIFTSEKYVSLSTGNIGTNGSYACTESYIPCSNLVGQTITLNQIPGGTQPGMAFYDSNNDYISGGKGDAITVPSNAVSYRFTVPIEYASGDDVQIELGSTATTYEPYSNICPITAYTEGEIEVSDGDGNTTTHTTTYPSAIYRGSEDVVNGTETHDMVCETFTTRIGGYVSPITGQFLAYLKAGIKSFANNVTGTQICDKLESTSGDQQYNNIGNYCIVNNLGRIYVSVVGCNTASDFDTWLASNPLQISYELATPATSPVTPTNLPIRTLSGYNHIESSTGDMEVEYITEGYQPIIDLEPEIEANPADVPTQTLTSLKINGVTYSLPSGGGGGEVVRASNTITINGGVS